MGWNDHFLNAGEDEEEKETTNMEQILKTPSYKVGYLKGCIEEAIRLLKLNQTFKAEKFLETSLGVLAEQERVSHEN